MTTNRREVIKGLALLPALGLVPTLGGRVARAEEAGRARVTLAIHTGDGPRRLEVELAETPAERRRGLMGRDHLDAEAGMLFLYDGLQSPESGFWMYRTGIPLDIAFIDAAGRIAAIHSMSPCDGEDPSQCRAYPAGVTYRAALEVNAGYFAARGVGIGDCVSWPGAAASCAAEG
ncbi:hypothetical protein HPA02_18520 [Bisbaumannia pacifica]|uniref:DUF192 domain-containing protein n=1 Tax=Bisbaumannia pacifica TaxID=77098 RepID=A0A510X807_9GAMM|nr:DUF192 domain-containing protein [Halomonas pacifica]GEK47569.1 hypothetical protein HPA02_18520 [Halomonas pacifica]